MALSVREALTNVVRHAHATEVFVSLVIEERTLVVQVADNGRGFRLDQLPRNCHGLASVRERLERIGGRAEWVSAPDHGTTVSFRLPLKEPPASNAEKKA